MAIGSASAFMKIGSPLCFLATILQGVAYATPGWIKQESGLGSLITLEAGLWQSCGGEFGCANLGSDDSIEYVRLNATRAMESLSILAMIIATAFSFQQLCNDRYRTKKYIQVCIVSTVFGALTNLIGISIYGATFIVSGLTTIYYSMALAIVALFLTSALSVLFFLESRRLSSYSAF